MRSFRTKKTPTLQELSQLWLEDRRPAVKRSTYVKYSDQIRLHILPGLGARRVHTLTRQDLESFAAALQTSGRADGTGGLSPKTVRDILCLLHNILHYGQKLALTEAVPSTDGLLCPVRRQRPRVMELTDCRALEAFLRSRGDLASCGILLALYTGLRLGEVCALRWKHIDLQHGILRVEATMQRLPRWQEGPGPKTGLVCLPPKSASSLRMIPLPETMRSLLAAQERAGEEAFFLTGSEGKCMEPRLLEYKFKNALNCCGLGDIHFHTLRHTFATRCVEVGFDIKSLSEILGHSNVQTTMSLYVHPTMEHKRQNMNKVHY